MDEAGEEVPKLKDIRRYFCDYCGICRSKKSLIASHILTHHKDGRPPEKLPQADLNHATRQYVCPVDDCRCSYIRKDHLTRHLLRHMGKLFKCPIQNCNREFAFQGNVKRHVIEQHDEDYPSDECEKKYVCPEVGCGKAFRFPSKLRKHEDSHVKLNAVEAVCAEAGCMKTFTNEQCLKAHIQSCHQHHTCEICGSKQLKKNIKRHLRTHEEKISMESIKCNFKDCDHTFSTKSNLNQHVKAAHLKQKPFTCSFSDCGMRFAYKHVRDNHEKTACHVYTYGDFEEADELFRSRPRGGRKRKYPTVEMLVRKRVTPPNQLDGTSDYFSMFLSEEEQGELQ
ncbi:hypothetical protein TIFTF001_014344 [Ficus carica]|uniref:C2H2-type domain-containing protein n=1 Tax=Ficus carica TaxID=3494 RepID=A0AA88D5I4_FICCA|nr:hypothetical protein TIFTF001_014344 [Ficus carica]